MESNKPEFTRDAFTAEFELHRNQLKSFILRITASKADAEDIVQETYLRAADRLNSFRGDSSVKTWVFTIASNLAKDNLRAKKRWPEHVNDVCKERALADPAYFNDVALLQQSSPQAQFEIKEHIAFCVTCIAKSLPLDQQVCLLLKEVHAFKVFEIAKITDSSEAMVKYYLHAARSKLVTVFEARCSLINKEGACHQCSELNGIFNPKQHFEIEKNKIELARQANDPDKEHLLNLRLKLLSDIDPFHSAGSDLQLHHLEYNRRVMEDFGN